MTNVLNDYTFTEQDRTILNAQKAFADTLGNLFGTNCEVILHSFEDLNRSVIHIVNGQVTGREIGAGITNVALEQIRNFKTSEKNWNVYFSNKRGDDFTFKSSSTLITNFTGDVIGMLCINYSLDISLQGFMNTFSPNQCETKTENFTDDVNSMVLNHLLPIKQQIYSNKEIASKSKVNEIVKQLHRIGLFELPITTKIVSAELSVSTAAIYKHLRALKSA